MSEPADRRRVPVARHVVWALGDYPNAIRLRERSIRESAVPPSFAAGTRRPVVVLPGVWETWHYLRAIAERLSAAGHPVHVVPRLGLNLAPIPESAAIVAERLAELDARGVALVAHSKGGLIGKQLMLTDDPEHRVDRLVAVATPFAGSRLARLTLLRSLRRFRPDHPEIRALVAELEVNRRITSVFPSFDPHIPEGSRLDGARNVELPIVGHFRVLRRPETADAVLAAVADEPDPDAVAADR